MRIIGLTGGIASGKSTASAHLEALGARVIDADLISRSLTADGSPMLYELNRVFDGILNSDGSLNRSALAQTVFFDAAQRQRLEALLHPHITTAMLAEIEAARRDGDAIVVLSIPLLFEARMDALCDEIWTVDAPQVLRIERMMKRGLTHAEALARMASQMPDDERNRRSRFILNGSGPSDRLHAQIDALWQTMKQD